MKTASIQRHTRSFCSTGHRSRLSGTALHRIAPCNTQDESKATTTTTTTEEQLTFMPPIPDMVQTTSVVTAIPAAGYLVVFLALFALICYDVASPMSAHFLQPLDLAVHNNVMASVPLDFRSFAADKAISNLPIGLAILGILVGLQVVLARNVKKGLFLVGLVGAFNVLFGGIGLNLDAQATAALKNFFQRVRPSTDLHSSFSFPSGHSTSVYFLAGFLFFIVMPAVYEALKEDAQRHTPQATSPESATAGIHAIDVLEAMAQPLNATALTVGLGSVTQTGRLLADVHWTSDVMAGMLWGSCGVAMALIVQDLVFRVAGEQLHAAPADSDISQPSNGNGTNGAGKQHGE